MPFGAKASIGGCVLVFASPVSKVFMLHFVFVVDFGSFALFHFSKSKLQPQTESSVVWLMQDCDISVALCCSYLFMRGLALLMVLFLSQVHLKSPSQHAQRLIACVDQHVPTDANCLRFSRRDNLQRSDDTAPHHPPHSPHAPPHAPPSTPST